jgi:hypothetical protein
MKFLLFCAALATAALPLRADDWLENEFFLHGKDHWYGQVQWPEDFAAADPFTTADPLTAKGMIATLKPSHWVSAFQDFKGKGGNAVLTITYVVAPNTSFSKKPEDYENVPDKIGWDAWPAYNTPIGSFVVFIGDPSNYFFNFYPVSPKMDQKDPQTFTVNLSGLTPWSSKSLAISFPPGQGMVVVHKVTLVDPNDAQ